MKMDLFHTIFTTFSFLLTASHFSLEISVLTAERMTIDPEYRNQRLTVKHNRFCRDDSKERSFNYLCMGY